MQRSIRQLLTQKAEQYIPWNIVGIFQHSAQWMSAPRTEGAYKNPKNLTGKGIAIYCVHGTFDEASAFNELIPRLLDNLSAEFSEIRAVEFMRRWRGIGIKSYSYQILKMILMNGDTDVFFLAHSRGGLIVSYFAEFLAKNYNINVHGICNVSSPFGGTRFAIKPFTKISKSVKDMQKDSDLLKTLNEQIRISLIDYLYFVGSFDFIVTVNSACIKEHIHLLHVLNRHGHLSVLFSPELAEKVKEFLNKHGEVIQEQRESMMAQLKDANVFSDKTNQLIADYAFEPKPRRMAI